MRREFLVNGNLLGVDRDVAAGAEVLDDAIHHLARAADSRGDILLRQAFGHHPRPVAFDRVLVEELGETAVDVLQGPVAHLPDQTPQPSAGPRGGGPQAMPSRRNWLTDGFPPTWRRPRLAQGEVKFWDDRGRLSLAPKHPT